MANDDITWVRPEHRAASAAWRKYRDFCKGVEAVKAAGNKYLPYLDPPDKSSRNRKRNEDYLSRAVFYAIAGNTKIGMLGMAYRKDPRLTVLKSSNTYWTMLTGPVPASISSRNW